MGPWGRVCRVLGRQVNGFSVWGLPCPHSALDTARGTPGLWLEASPSFFRIREAARLLLGTALACGGQQGTWGQGQGLSLGQSWAPYHGSRGLFGLWCSGLLGAIAECLGAANQGSRQGGWLWTGSVGNCRAEWPRLTSRLGGISVPTPVREVQGLVWGIVLSGCDLLALRADWACGLHLPPARQVCWGQSCSGHLTLRDLRVQATWRGRRCLLWCGRAPQPGAGRPLCPQLLSQEEVQCALQPWVLHAHQSARQAQQAHRLFPGLCLPGFQALGLGAAMGGPQGQGQVAVQKAEAVSLKGALQGLVGQGRGLGGPLEAVGGEAQ